MAFTTEDILVFGNPISGAGRGLSIAQEIAEAAYRSGFNARLYLDPASTAPDSWIPQSGSGVVVSVGGDGTLRTVADRLVAYAGTHGTSPSVLTVPLGTANLVANHLGSKWKRNSLAKDVLSAIRAGRKRKLDVACANGKAMLAVGGVGFDAQVVHELSARRRGPISYADYVLPTMLSLAGYRFRPISVKVDGREISHDSPAIAFVGNIPEYGAGFSVTPNARGDDGLLDVCVLPCRSWQELMELGCICGTGTHVANERVIYLRGKHIEVTSNEKVPVQIDGDEGGFAPVTFDLLDRQMTFIVPADAR